MGSLKDFSSIILLYLASLLLFVAITTKSWRSIKLFGKFVDIDIGLFKHCAQDVCVDNEGDKKVKAMEVLGLLAAVFGAICMTVHQALKSNKVINALPKVVLFTSIAGACLVFLGCGIYGFDYFRTSSFNSEVYPSFSFFLAIVGGIILLVGGALGAKK